MVSGIGKRRLLLVSLAIIVIAIIAVASYLFIIPYLLRPAPVKGSIVVYAAIHEFEADRLLRTFTEETGIEAKYVRMSAGEIEARLKAEAAAGQIQADVVLGGPMINHESMKKAGLLYKWDQPPPNARDIPSQYHDPDNYWFGFYVGAIAFCINSDRLSKLGLPEPGGWEDLTKPEYKGQYAIADPRTSGTAYTVLATLLSLYPEDRAWSIASTIWKNAGAVPKAGAAPAQMCATGEYPIGIAFAHDILKLLMAGYKVKIVYPAEGTGWEIGGVAVVKGAPNLEAAKVFVNWVLGRKAGQLHTDLSMRLSTRGDVVPPPGTVPLSQINIVRDFKWKWAAENRDTILKTWESAVG